MAPRTVSSLNPDQKALCLNTIYFSSMSVLYWHKHCFAVGSLMILIVAILYMEAVEKKALSSFQEETPFHWFRWWHLGEGQNQEGTWNISFTREEQPAGLPGLSSHQSWRKRSTNRIHMNRYLWFDSFQHKQERIKTQNHRAKQTLQRESKKSKWGPSISHHLTWICLRNLREGLLNTKWVHSGPVAAGLWHEWEWSDPFVFCGSRKEDLLSWTMETK